MHMEIRMQSIKFRFSSIFVTHSASRMQHGAIGVSGELRN